MPLSEGNSVPLGAGLIHEYYGGLKFRRSVFSYNFIT